MLFLLTSLIGVVILCGIVLSVKIEEDRGGKSVKIFAIFELENGVAIQQEIHGNLKESMIKWDDDTRANFISDFLNDNKGKFITHGSRIVQVDKIVSAYIQVREG